MNVRNFAASAFNVMVLAKESKDVHEVKTNWNGKMQFVCEVNEHQVFLDKKEVHGGADSGPRPKPLILAAACGCMGMEIVSLAEKMRIKLEDLSITADGELTEAHPKMYSGVHMVINVMLDERSNERFRKAVDLAWDHYCGVIAMIKKFATASYEIRFTNEHSESNIL